MSLIWKRILIISSAAIFIFLLIFFLIIYTPKPPVSDMAYARNAISLATRDKADAYSKKLYKEAKGYYDSALRSWQKENKRFLYFRDYSKVAKLAKLAVKAANQAADSSIFTSSNLKSSLKQKIDVLDDLANNIDELFTTYPLTTETRNRISKGGMLLKEARIIYQKGRYLEADKKLIESEYLLTTSYENASINLKNYFKSYPEWKKLAEETIANSRDSGDYSTELGKNWVGDKMVRGDKATPEGMYKITMKFGSNKTKYYKALLLDYPNEEDTAKFRAAIEKGILPRSAKIGGLIEIHGNGGKGIDWTEGCIALTDREMDSVFKIVKVGTPVTIIGSMLDLQHVMKR